MWNLETLSVMMYPVLSNAFSVCAIILVWCISVIIGVKKFKSYAVFCALHSLTIALSLAAMYFGDSTEIDITRHFDTYINLVRILLICLLMDNLLMNGYMNRFNGFNIVVVSTFYIAVLMQSIKDKRDDMSMSRLFDMGAAGGISSMLINVGLINLFL